MGRCRVSATRVFVEDLILLVAPAALSPVDPDSLDPESLDATRPVDVDCCGVCMGEGGIQVPTGFLYAQEFNGEECWGCGGTGERGAA